MRIQMELDRGYLPDAYGKYAAPEDCYDWSCRRSFPFTVEGVPYGTRALAVFFIDWDSVPVCGFPWIHWCAYVNGDFEGDIEFPDDLSPSEAWDMSAPARPTATTNTRCRLSRSTTSRSSKRRSGPTNCSMPAAATPSTKQARFCPAGARKRQRKPVNLIGSNPFVMQNKSGQARQQDTAKNRRSDQDSEQGLSRVQFG